MALAPAMGGPSDRLRAVRFPLETERLLLRPPRSSDLPELVPLIDDRRISDPTTIPHPYDLAEGRRFVRKASLQRRAGRDLALLAIDRSDGSILGGLGLTLRGTDLAHPWAEVGYWVRVDAWGRGYASEGLAETLRVGFVDLRLRRIEAWVKGFNPASVRVLRKAGFRIEGRARSSLVHRGRPYDRILLGLLREEYRARARGPRRGRRPPKR